MRVEEGEGSCLGADRPLAKVRKAEPGHASCGKGNLELPAVELNLRRCRRYTVSVGVEEGLKMPFRLFIQRITEDGSLDGSLLEHPIIDGRS